MINPARLDAVLGVSSTEFGDFRLDPIGRTASWNDRIGISLGRKRFTISKGLLPPEIDRRIDQAVLGVKRKLAGDLIFADLPQMAVA